MSQSNSIYDSIYSNAEKDMKEEQCVNIVQISNNKISACRFNQKFILEFHYLEDSKTIHITIISEGFKWSDSLNISEWNEKFKIMIERGLLRTYASSLRKHDFSFSVRMGVEEIK